MNDSPRAASVPEAVAWIDQQISILPWETVPLDEAAGRVLAFDVKSKFDVPAFDRAMTDGFAVQAADTNEASAQQPVELALAGQVQPGHLPTAALRAGQVWRVWTGAALPKGADAVLGAEAADETGHSIRVHRPMEAGANCGRKAEDIAAGTVVLPAERRLRAQDVGVLSSLGISSVAGFGPEWPHRRVKLPLGQAISAELGKTELARVKIDDGQVVPIAISGSSILTSTTRADGFVIVPEQSDGIEKGTEVEVFLYD